MKGSSTLQDVAKLADVSVGTVSRFLNGYKISSKNEKNIEKAIDILNYLPNPLARNLAKGKTFAILLYIVAESPIVSSTWLHELPIIQGISDIVKESGYSLSIEIESIYNKALIKNIFDRYSHNKHFDGLIILTSWELDETLFVPLDYRDFPYIVVGSNCNHRTNKTIEFDNYTPIFNIVMHQYKLGHRKMALIGGFYDQIHMKERAEAYINALIELGLEPKKELIKYGNYSVQSGFDQACELLESPDLPTTIVCGNDYIALGAIKAIHSKKLRVPEDISISGFDATVVSEAASPSITTVEVPAYEMGKKAIHELLKKLEYPEYQIPNSLLKTTVIYRDSTAKIK